MEGIVAKLKSLPAPVWIGLLATVGIAIVLTRSTARSPNGTIAVQGSSATDATNSAGVAQEVGSLSQTLTNMLNANNQQMIDANTKSTTALQDSIHTDLQQLLTADATNAAATSGAIQSLQTLLGTGFVGLGGGVTTANQAVASAQSEPHIVSGPLGIGTQNLHYDPIGNTLSFTQRFKGGQKQAVFNLWDETTNQNFVDNSSVVGATKGTGTGWSGAFSVLVPSEGGQFTFANVPKLDPTHRYSIRIALPNEGGGVGNEPQFTGSSLTGG